MSEMSEVTTETRATIAVSSQGESWGDIVLKFYPDVAPNHARNFCKLAAENFYNGTTFHRVIPGFMIQGGDPNSKNADRSNHGMGGPGYHIKAEFNNKPHKRGVLSMARAQDPDSAGITVFYLRRRCVVPGWSIHGLRRSRQRHGNRRSRGQRQTRRPRQSPRTHRNDRDGFVLKRV